MSDFLDPSNYTYAEPEERVFHVFDRGIYPFTIKDVFEFTESREKKTPMLPITLEFSRSNGDTTNVKENILFQKSMQWKIDAFLSCVAGEAMKAGKVVDWTSDDFKAWLKRRTGTARLKVVEYTHNGEKRQKNEIDAFIFTAANAVGSAKKSPPPEPEPAAADDDDIPF